VEWWGSKGRFEEKGSKGWGGLMLSGSFAALRMTAKTKEQRQKEGFGGKVKAKGRF
jgi:hypothetical protein